MARLPSWSSAFPGRACGPFAELELRGPGRAEPQLGNAALGRTMQDKQMFIVGLTGGIGSGKSAAAACFSALGITVVDADWAARMVVEPGQPALEKIAAHFGAEVLRENGGLNRARLRAIVFDSEEQRRWLEQLLHPLIREEILRSLDASQSPYSILESPLLIESSQYQLVDRICVVDLPEALQIERASARDTNNPQQIRKIMAAQLSREERLAKADDVLDNSGSLVELRQQVAILHERYLQLATESGST